MKKILSILICSALLLCACRGDRHSTRSVHAKGTLELSVEMCESINPLLAQKQSMRECLALCYEPLFIIDENMTAKGVLAEKCEIADDARSAIITLNSDVRWHDGSRFCADDVVAAIEFIKESTDSPYFECVKNIEMADAIDESSVKLKLTKPYSMIVYSLYFPIVSSRVKNYEKKVVGTGPYVFKKYVAASRLEFSANENWHGGKAKIKKIVCSQMRDKKTQATAFYSSVTDMITSQSYDLCNNKITSQMRSQSYNTKKYDYLAFNNLREPFNNASVRSGISLALDRSSIVKEVYQGNAIEANVPRHPLCANPPSPTYAQCDAGAALEKLFYGGYSKSEKTNKMLGSNKKVLKFTITINKENELRTKLANAIARQLADIGISVQVCALDYDDYIKAVEGGNYDAYLATVSFANIYDCGFLIGNDGALNNFGYTDEYTQRAILKTETSAEESALDDAIVALDESFIRNQPICGIAFEKDVLISSGIIKGRLAPKTDNPFANIAEITLK